MADHHQVYKINQSTYLFSNMKAAQYDSNE